MNKQRNDALWNNLRNNIPIIGIVSTFFMTIGLSLFDFILNKFWDNAYKGLVDKVVSHPHLSIFISFSLGAIFITIVFTIFNLKKENREKQQTNGSTLNNIAVDIEYQKVVSGNDSDNRLAIAKLHDQKYYKVENRLIRNEDYEYIFKSPKITKIKICGIGLEHALNQFILGKIDGSGDISGYDLNYFKLIQDQQKDCPLGIEMYFWRPDALILDLRARQELLTSEINWMPRYKKYILDSWLSIGKACLIPFYYKKLIAQSEKKNIINFEIYIVDDDAFPIMHLITNEVAITGYYSATTGNETVRCFIPANIPGDTNNLYNIADREFDKIKNGNNKAYLVTTGKDSIILLKRQIKKLLGKLKNDCDGVSDSKNEMNHKNNEELKFRPISEITLGGNLDPRVLKIKNAIHALVNHEDNKYELQDFINLRNVIEEYNPILSIFNKQLK